MTGAGQIHSAKLEDGDTSVTLLNLGCITQDWRVPCGGAQVPVVLGYADPDDYRDNPNALGIIAGRVANRIAQGRFVLDGQTFQLDCNEGPHHLHGGTGGIGTRIWNMDRDGEKAVRMALVSQDGDQGYPGEVSFEVTVTLAGQRVTYDMRAWSDRPTPINLAQHSYYNLMGLGTILDHNLHIAADACTPVDASKIPTGQIARIDGTPLDFRLAKPVCQADPESEGIDVNLVLTTAESPAVTVTAPNGMVLRLFTDQPGVQLYTGKHLTSGAAALPGQTHGPFAGLCLEPQHFPDTPNQPDFPSILITPDHPYRQILSVEIGQET